MRTKKKNKKQDGCCPWCGAKIVQMANSVFWVCIKGTPSGDPRGWGCGWWGKL